MLLRFVSTGKNVSGIPLILNAKKLFLSMATSNDESNKENMVNDGAEQIVTMEKVVAADNKGIDYDKLISKLISIKLRPLEYYAMICYDLNASKQSKLLWKLKYTLFRLFLCLFCFFVEAGLLYVGGFTVYKQIFCYLNFVNQRTKACLVLTANRSGVDNREL